MNEQIEKLIKASQAIKELLDIVALDVQKNCAHEECYECTHEASQLNNNRHKPPCRICLECRLAEAGWGCGYGLLKKSKVIKTINRSELYQMMIPGQVKQTIKLKRIN